MPLLDETENLAAVPGLFSSHARVQIAEKSPSVCLGVGSLTAAALQGVASGDVLRWVRELALPKPERCAARAERRVEEQFRLERDNPWTPERRAAALEAERRRYNLFGHF